MPRSNVQPEINVTPLVDVVLVLLIIFMVVTPKLDGGPNLELPPATNAAKPSDGPEPVEVSLTRSGELFLGGETVTRDRLVEHLREIHADTPQRRVVLKGDREVAYAEVREIFRVCQDVGFRGVSLQVVERPASRG